MMEALVAASLVVVGLVGLFQLMYSSVTRDKEAVHNLQATYLAAEGIELVKNQIDWNVANAASGVKWNENLSTGSYNDVSFDNLAQGGTGAVYFSTSTGMFTGNNPIFTSSGGRETSLFSRVVSVAVGTNEIDVTSTVSWRENNQTKSVALDDQFYNWRQ